MLWITKFLITFDSFSWVLIKVLTKEEKDMADDTKQDTSGFGTLLLIAEVMLK